MKLQKFFARDKSKPTKVIPIGRDPDAATHPIIDEDSISAHHPSFASPALLQSPPLQHRDQPRLIARSSNEEHWEVVPPGPGDDTGHAPSPRAHHFMAPAIPSRSSSLNSGTSPQMSSMLAPLPRSSSPYSISSNAIPAQGIRTQRSDPQVLRKKPTPPQGGGGVAALGILKALEPHQEVPLLQQELSDDYSTPVEPVRVDKDKKKGFWDGMLRDRDRDKSKGDRDRERERDRWDRGRDRDRRDDDLNAAELTRMIGYLTATASEDWAIVMEVSERASANEANAKEAARALRREFKYAEPKAQLAAARLWAIMLRNASDVFIQQISQRKFIEALDDVLTSPRTSPVVRERLMEVLAAAVFLTSTRMLHGSKDKDGFRNLWCRLKPADKPDTGVPFDTDDVMFSPPVVALPRTSSQYSLETPTFAQQVFSRDDLSPTPPLIEHSPPRRHIQQRVIQPDEDIRRLFQECKIARGNADVLAQSLGFARPDALDSGLIPEFLAKCRASQELIYTQIPWASAGAERSRIEKALTFTHGSQQDLSVANTEGVPDELTVEEELLAALLDANEALVSSLRIYDDLARVATERATEEKSRKETRMDRRQLNDDQLVEPQGPYTGQSVPSPPLPSPTLRQQFEVPAIVPSFNHPLPRIPPSLTPTTPTPNHPQSHQFGSQANTPTLLVPQHPLGPRSPVPVVTSSRTPSPDRMPRPSREDSGGSGREYISDDLERLNIEDDESSYSDGDARTPIRPSAKALGKRRLVEDPEDVETANTFFSRDDPYREQALDYDSDDVGFLPKRQPTRYVYDAAAERTAQHLREGRLVNGVH